ncbi:MAG TPA: hypothetical protein VIU11_14155 [Nakamurella sp.]
MDADVEKKVTELNAGWFNYLAKILKVDSKTFLLTQGTMGLQSTDSSGLFLISDAVPPPANATYVDASGLGTRSSAYAMLLQALLSEGGTDLPGVLGDMYAKWLAYCDSWYDKNPESTLTQEQLFEQWANQRLDPKKAASAISVYKQSSGSPLSKALDALNANKNAKQQFVTSDQSTYWLYRYTATIDAATAALANSSAVSIDFDSSSMDTHLAHDTVQGTATGFYDIFSGGVSGSFDKLNSEAAASGWTITGTIGQSATLITQPIGDWFDSGEFKRAYNAKDDRSIWDPMAHAGDWDSFFEQPQGSLARRVSQLVLVSDYDIKVTSQAVYSSDDRTKITASANFGVWPFFSSSASVSHLFETTLDAEGHLTVTWRLPKGSIQIWGLTVEAAPN